MDLGQQLALPGFQALLVGLEQPGRLHQLQLLALAQAQLVLDAAAHPEPACCWTRLSAWEAQGAAGLFQHCMALCPEAAHLLLRGRPAPAGSAEASIPTVPDYLGAAGQAAQH